MTATKTDDEKIRDKVESLVERGPEECLFFTFIIERAGSSLGLKKYIQKNDDDYEMTLIVHASSESEAVLVTADNIVKNTATSDYPVTYRDIFGETPNDLDGMELEGVCFEFFDVSKVKHLE